MIEWYSSNELAGLPGLSDLPESIQRKAGKENWKKQIILSENPENRKKRNRCYYHISSLPKVTQDHLKGLQGVDCPSPVNDVVEEPVSGSVVESAMDLPVVDVLNELVNCLRMVLPPSAEVFTKEVLTIKALEKVIGRKLSILSVQLSDSIVIEE